MCSRSMHVPTIRLLCSQMVLCVPLDRPVWIIVERTMLHFMWRASQVGWRGHLSTAPAHVATLSKDLLNLALHNYAAVRS